MPHITIEYTANLEPELDVPALIAALHATAATIEAFPLAGLRTRSERREHFRVADGHPDNAFVHVVLRIAHGRPLDVRKAAGDALFDSLCRSLASIEAHRPLAVSFEVQEIDPDLNYKHGNIRDYLAQRASERA